MGAGHGIMVAVAGPPIFKPFAEDGFGVRSTGIDPERGDVADLLELAPSLVAHAGFVGALGQRVARFASVNHTSYARLRRLDRPASDRLVLVSDRTPGWRLLDLLRMAAERQLVLGTPEAVSLLRQLLPAVTLFGRNNRDSAIGTLSVARLIVTPAGRLVIAEHAFGTAVEKLGLGRERLWREFRVAMPPSPGLPRASARADAAALGVVALSLFVGHEPLEGEFPGQLPELIEAAMVRHAKEAAPLSRAFADWLERALQLDARSAFQSPHEAQVAFETILASDATQVTSSDALEWFVASVGPLLDAASAEAVDMHAPPAAVVAPQSQPAPAPQSEPALIVATPPATPPAASPALVPPAPAVPAALAAAAASVTAVPITRVWLVITLVVLALGQSGLFWFWSRTSATAVAAPAAGDGELVVQSRPTSARVSIDGTDRGVTPLTLQLPAGTHILEIQTGKSEPRVIPLTIRAGAQTAQYVELQNVPVTGAIEVRSDPSGAQVSLDGQSRGVAPAILADLPPGDHDIQLSANGRIVKQTVRVDAGTTTLLVVPMPGVTP